MNMFDVISSSAELEIRPEFMAARHIASRFDSIPWSRSHNRSILAHAGAGVSREYKLCGR